MRLQRYRTELLKLLQIEEPTDERVEKLVPVIAWLHAHGFTRIAALGVLRQKLAKDAQ